VRFERIGRTDGDIIVTSKEVMSKRKFDRNEKNNKIIYFGLNFLIVD